MLPARDWMRIFASCDLAWPIFSKIFGPTKAMMPASRMNTMTISRIVNPRSRFTERARPRAGGGPIRVWRRMGTFPFLLNREVVHGKHRREDRDDDEADHHRHADDHHRLQQRERLADGDLDLA